MGITLGHIIALRPNSSLIFSDALLLLLVSTYYKEDQQILVSCILSVTVLTLLSSIVATVISLGYPREKMEFLRHYSVFNIVSCEKDTLSDYRSCILWASITANLFY